MEVARERGILIYDQTGSTRPGESTASDETLASLELPLDFLVSGEGRTAAGKEYLSSIMGCRRHFPK